MVDVEVTTIVLISNTLVNIVLGTLYAYRVKIEKKQVEIMAKNAEAKEVLETMKKYVEKEKDELKTMTPQELENFIEYLIHLGEEE